MFSYSNVLEIQIIDFCLLGLWEVTVKGFWRGRVRGVGTKSVIMFDVTDEKNLCSCIHGDLICNLFLKYFFQKYF